MNLHTIITCSYTLGVTIGSWRTSYPTIHFEGELVANCGFPQLVMRLDGYTHAHAHTINEKMFYYIGFYGLRDALTGAEISRGNDTSTIFITQSQPNYMRRSSVFFLFRLPQNI